MPDHSLAGRRILIVEDEFMLADHLQDVLEEAGAIVLGPAADLAGALLLLATLATPDGAILDINLGGEPSYPVADELLRRDVPFLFTSGYDLDAIPARYRDIPRCQKPLSVRAVRQTIGRIVDR